MTKTLTKIVPLAAALILALPASALAAPKPKVQFGSSAYAVAESAGAATITVVRPARPAKRLTAMTVDYSASTGSAVTGVDFTPVSGTLAFASGETSKTFSVPVLDDSVVDGPRTVNLTLSHAVMDSGARAILSSPSSAVLVIADDDSGAQPQPTFQFAVATDIVSEASPSETVYVVRSGDLGNGADVDYTTADGSALAGTDYTAATGTLHFPDEATDAAGAVIQSIAVPIRHNPATSPATRDFSVSLRLPSGSNGVLGSPSSQTVTIVNIDGTPVLQWSAAGYSVSEDAGSVRLTALVAGSVPAGDTGVTVDFATAPGSAKPGINYASQSDTLQFLEGDVAQSVDIPVMNDGKAGNTYFTAALSNPVGGTLGSPSTATVNIRDVLHPYTIPSVGTTNPAGNTPGAGGGSNGGGQAVLGARQSVCGLTVKAAKKQRLLKKKALVLKLRANQRCRVGLGTTIKQLKAKKKHRKAGHAAKALRFKGRKVSLSLQPGKAKTVRVKFTKRTLKAIKKALRARKRLVASVVVTERATSSAPAQKRTLKITVRR
jgi:hypothetical protein